jgi:hypothetical protein
VSFVPLWLSAVDSGKFLARFSFISDNDFSTARLFPDKTPENRGEDSGKDKPASRFRENARS